MNRFVKEAATFVLVKDVKRSIEFYTDVLDFRVKHNPPDPAFAKAGAAEIMLVEMWEEVTEEAPQRGLSIYLFTEEIDAYYAQVLPKLEASPYGELAIPLQDRPWGQREFHVIDPDGAELRFGQTIV